jgi:hypothetical protein
MYKRRIIQIYINKGFRLAEKKENEHLKREKEQEKQGNKQTIRE